MELNEIEKTNGSTMQEFDFTDITTENSLSEIAEKLSPPGLFHIVLELYP